MAEEKTSVRTAGNTEVLGVPKSGPRLTIKGQEVHSAIRPQTDIVFVIDTTGSMNDKIEGLISTSVRFVDKLMEYNLDHRLGAVSFGDLTVTGDRIDSFAFVREAQAMKQILGNLPRNYGGGNEGESSFEAIAAATALGFRSHAVKVIVLLTDEPALQHNIRAEQAIHQLRNGEFLTFVASPPMQYFQDMAIQTGGKWYQISAQTDFLDLLQMFSELSEKLARTVDGVHSLGQGSLKKYLALKPQND
jgi:hypothetical protein